MGLGMECEFRHEAKAWKKTRSETKMWLLHVVTGWLVFFPLLMLGVKENN